LSTPNPPLGGITNVYPKVNYQQCWSPVPNSGDLVLFWNTDTTVTVYLGFQNYITAAGLNTIPLLPNQAIQLPANRAVYVIAGASSVLPLVVIPGGSLPFLGLTAGLGNLVIPSIQSPNFVSGSTGWQIAKDGSAQFNNVTVRGNIAYPTGFLSDGDGTYTTTPGLFFYSGTPAAGNLIYANTGTSAGHDKFNNNYPAGETSFNNSTFVAVNLNNEELQWYTFTTQPNATFTSAASLVLDSGGNIVLNTLGGGSGFALNNANSAETFLYSRGDGSLGYIGPLDEAVYTCGKQWGYVTSDILINSTTPISVANVAVVTGIHYRWKVCLLITEQQAAGTFSIGWNGSATVSGVGYVCLGQDGGGGVALNAVTNTNSTPALKTSATMAGENALYVGEGEFDASVSGTLNIRAQVSVATDTCKVIHGSYFFVEPIG
jgi:hypothetical protein